MTIQIVWKEKRTRRIQGITINKYSRGQWIRILFFSFLIAESTTTTSQRDVKGIQLKCLQLLWVNEGRG